MGLGKRRQWLVLLLSAPCALALALFGVSCATRFSVSAAFDLHSSVFLRKAELDELQVRFTELSMGMSMPHPDGLNSLDEVPGSSADDESMSMSDFGS